MVVFPPTVNPHADIRRFVSGAPQSGQGRDAVPVGTRSSKSFPHAGQWNSYKGIPFLPVHSGEV